MNSKLVRIGSLNYVSDGVEYKTEFKVSEKVESFLDKEGTSLACLIPDAWSWYESELFDVLDDDMTGTPDKKYGNKFEVVYYGVITKREGDVDETVEEGFADDVSFDDDSLLDYLAETNISSVKSGKDFIIEYEVVTKNE